jgi:succinate dehydrogenase / fumarate reductase cytochrome b subunit
VTKKRPVNLQLTTMQFPATAIVSILHRVSGFVIFLLLPLFLWMLSASLGSVDQFDALKACMTSPVMKFILWIILSAIAYHVVAGLRHLLMDFGVAEEKESGKIGAITAMVLAFVVILVMGIIIW